MRNYIILKISLFLIGWLSSIPVFSQTKIEGCWELIDITALNIMNTPPQGISSRKDYYSEDGMLYVIAPENKIDDASITSKYEFDGENRKVVTKSGSEVFTKSTIKDDTLILHFSETEKWTYRYLGGELSCNKPIEPKSVLVVATNNPNDQKTNLDINYDESDYSNLGIRERISGIWEVNEHFEFSPRNAPPYGFSNKLYVFKNDKFYILSAGETSIDGKKAMEYSLKDNKMLLGENSNKAVELDIKFNKWGHIILSKSGRGFVLKLLTKDVNRIPLIPTKIVVLRLVK